MQSRRSFLNQSLLAAGALAIGPRSLLGANPATRISLALYAGSIGVRANQRQSLEMAHEFGFQAVEVLPGELMQMTERERQEIVELKEKLNLSWATASLPTQFKGSESDFQNDLKNLPALARMLASLGVTTLNTWLSPSHREFTYTKNFSLHTARMKAIMSVLSDHGLRLGMEYIGTTTLLLRAKYPFIHTMAEALDLVDSVGNPSLGIVLDSWHWWQAGDTPADILQLRAGQIMLLDFNDAPLNVPKPEQRDNQRELPLATGVIDLKGFLHALDQIGYSGPARAEPFNKVLQDMEDRQALSTTLEAMKRSLELLP